MAGSEVTAEVPDVRIGARLRSARLAQRRTMAEVAAASGLTKGFLSRLERDQANASVAALVRLCAALDLPVGSLFEPAPAGEVVLAGEYPPIAFGGHGLREFLLTPRGERRLAAIVSEAGPGGGSGDEPYGLPADVEFVLVLAGAVHLRFPAPDGSEAAVDLAEGDAFTFPPSAPHTFTAGPDGARVLWVISPALPDEAARLLPGDRD
ncbi:helix-turn-helix domain-containing protein [Kineococcus rubinsiae]|uniref:helix-turn-helix domain-containing protein n=1 Tax=Kineococcus rubinsiae TaxID=2609562 RepID=UPI0027E52DC9|nr:XRE family transcriptional regulator [Kineococcus rubinsiae]